MESFNLNKNEKNEIKLSRSDEKFKWLFELSPVGMALINHQTGEFIEVNQSLLTTTGYTKEEFLKLSFWDITPHEYREQELQQMKDLESKGRFGPNEKEYIRKDGSRFPVRISGFSFDDVDGTKLVWGIIEDISSQYRRIFNDLRDAYIQIDLSYNLILVNPTAIKMFGYNTYDEMIGLSVDKLFLDQDGLEKIREYLDKNDNLNDFSCQYVRKDGTWFWGSLNVQLVNDKLGSLIAIEGVIRDISEQKRIEAEVSANEAKFKTAFMTGADAFYWATLKDGKIIEINDSFESFFGYSREEAIGKTSTELNLYSEPSDRARMISELKEKGVIRNFELVGRKKDGSKIFASLSSSIVNINGEHYSLGILHDITDRKNTQETILNLNQNLRTLSDRMVFATHSAKLGIWDWDVVNNDLIWDDGMYNLYNIHRKDFNGAYEAWMYHIHPKDKEKAEIAIQDALQGIKDYNIEFRILWSNGSVHYIYATGQVFFDSNGKPLRMVGINQDITQNKNLEISLYETVKQNQRILENLQDAYFQADLKGVFTIVNPIAVQLYGYNSADEMLGQPAKSLYANPIDRDIMIATLKQEGQVKDYTCQGLRKDGTAFWVSMNVQFVKNNDGTIMGTEGVVRDISKRIQDENKIKHEVQRYDALIESTNDWIWVVDSKSFDLVLFNSSVADYFKRNHNIILRPGMPNDEMLSESRRILWRQLYTKAIKEGKFSIEYQTASENIHFLVSLAPVVIDDSIVGVSIFAKDISKEVHYKEELEASNIMLSSRLNQTINAISKIGEMRDVYTAGHQRRVAELACAIAKEMGLSEEKVNNIYFGALIHDIGKINIASDILNKPGKISSLEYRILQTHVDQSFDIVKGIDFPSQIISMIYQHHEYLDGSGYPKGLHGDQIILESRILTVSDVVEAMSSHRPYRAALGTQKALEEILMNKGKKYDKDVVDACVRLFIEKGFAFTTYM